MGLGRSNILCSILVYIESAEHAKLNQNTAGQELQWNPSKVDTTGITPACPEYGGIRLLFVKELLVCMELKPTHHL